MTADTTWPPSLTRMPRVSELEETAPEVVIRSEVDVGPAKIRRRFTGDKRRFTVVLDLRRSEVATFDTWFKDTTYGGALSFSWELPRTGVAADFRFLSTPSYRPQAPRGDGTEWWRVSFEIEMLPGTDSSIPPPAGGGDPPGGGNWLLWIQPGSDDVAGIEEEEPEISFGTVFEADAPAPVYLFEILGKNYGLDDVFEQTEEEAAAAGPIGVGSVQAVTVAISGSTVIDGAPAA
ncbi:MAG: hypothetical protein C4529_07060 [Deltaproteobacteria bacterium]|nr:MAG: hypothetical protein C4529_07060 [Deltaproteobacteria bacterium]